MSRTDTFRPWEIYYVTIFFEILEFAEPVSPNGKDINIVLQNIINFLTDILFDYDIISKSGSLNRLNTFKYVITYIKFAAVTIKTVGCNTNNQIISESLSSF